MKSWCGSGSASAPSGSIEMCSVSSSSSASRVARCLLGEWVAGGGREAGPASGPWRVAASTRCVPGRSRGSRAKLAFPCGASGDRALRKVCRRRLRRATSDRTRSGRSELHRSCSFVSSRSSTRSHQAWLRPVRSGLPCWRFGASFATPRVECVRRRAGSRAPADVPEPRLPARSASHRS